MFERFTGPAREAVVQAQTEARELGDPTIGTEHVLLGALWNADGVTKEVIDELGLGYRPVADHLARQGSDDSDELLGRLGIDMAEVRRRVEAEFGPGALGRRRPTRASHLRFERDAKKALELSLREALNLRHNYIGVEHLLLALSRVDRTPATELITAAGVDPHRLHDQLRDRLQAAA